MTNEICPFIYYIYMLHTTLARRFSSAEKTYKGWYRGVTIYQPNFKNNELYSIYYCEKDNPY